MFRHILRKLTKHIETAPLSLDPRRLDSIRKGEEKKVEFPLEFLCKSIDKFIRSEYTYKIIEQYGLESTYIIFKEETQGYCGIMSYVELVNDLKEKGKIFRKDQARVFFDDLDKELEELESYIKISEELQRQRRCGEK